MANTTAMLTIKKVLISTQGATGEMLSEGLIHALQDPPEARHELQVALLKMVTQVLTSVGSAAQAEAEGTCQQKVNAAQASLNARKAALVRATEELAAAQAATAAQRETVGERQRQVTLNHEEYKRVNSEDEDKAAEVASLEASKLEVVRLLEAMGTKGNGEVIMEYLKSAKAEGPLVAALRTVLDKEPADRIDFDLVVLQHLQVFLEQKVAEWTAKIADMVAAKANIHAEALGAWAIKEVDGEHVQEAMAELDAAEAAVAAAQQKLKEQEDILALEEGVHSQCVSELSLADDRARQCSTALEALQRLEAGQEMLQEEPAAVTAEQPMEVEFLNLADAEMAAAQVDAMDVEMGTPIAA